MAGTKTFSRFYETEEEAKHAASYDGRKELSTPWYSEVYLDGGPTLVEMTDGSMMWKVSFKEYYG